MSYDSNSKSTEKVRNLQHAPASSGAQRAMLFAGDYSREVALTSSGRETRTVEAEPKEREVAFGEVPTIPDSGWVATGSMLGKHSGRQHSSRGAVSDRIGLRTIGTRAAVRSTFACVKQ